MAKSKTKRKRTPKHVLKLPDLEQSKGNNILDRMDTFSGVLKHRHAEDTTGRN